MATVKFGAFVTEIVGSIGGSTFRRYKNGTILTNKITGASKNRTLLNPALSQLSTINSAWSQLTPNLRNSWNSEALNFQFLDKFGDLKNLTGRQLFTKLNNQAITSGQSEVNVLFLDSAVPNSDIDLIVLNLTPRTAIIFSQPVSDSTVCVQVQQTKNSSVNPSFKKYKTIYTELTNNTLQIVLTSEFFEAYPLAQLGDTFIFYIYFVNESGFESVQFSAKASITGLP